MQHTTPPRIAIVIPCYNEESVLPITSVTILRYVEQLKDRILISPESFICFIDDGSSDNTWNIILQLTTQNSCFKGIRLSRNFGHQGAVLAGMLEIDADAIISIDADMQDDETCIEKMLDEHKNGADIVYGVRIDRSTDALLKRFTAETYYRLLRKLGVPVVFNHADYRLMSKRAIDLLRNFDETNLFLRGIIPLVGLRTATTSYIRRKRAAGASKYPLSKMLAFAWQGITSFSIVPLRIVTVAGSLLSLGSTSIGLWALYVRYFGTGVVPGWASTVIPMYFLGGIQLLFLGILGEYVGKIYLETKHRPRYLIDARTFPSSQPDPSNRQWRSGRVRKAFPYRLKDTPEAAAPQTERTGPTR
jgi:glycosyltransferase involved in cell wall biosynthesis